MSGKSVIERRSRKIDRKNENQNGQSWVKSVMTKKVLPRDIGNGILGQTNRNVFYGKDFIWEDPRDRGKKQCMETRGMYVETVG